MQLWDYYHTHMFQLFTLSIYFFHKSDNNDFWRKKFRVLMQMQKSLFNKMLCSWVIKWRYRKTQEENLYTPAY